MEPITKKFFMQSHGKWVRDRDNRVLIFEDAARMEDTGSGGTDLGAWYEPPENAYERAKVMLRYHQVISTDALNDYNQYYSGLSAAVTNAKQHGSRGFLPDKKSSIAELKRLKGILTRSLSAFKQAQIDVENTKPAWMVVREAERSATMQAVEEFQDAIHALRF